MVKSGTMVSLSLASRNAIYDSALNSWSWPIPSGTIALNDDDIKAKRVYAIAVESLIVPNTFYGIRSINNVMNIEEVVISTSAVLGSYSIVLEQGNPTLLQVATELTQKINTATASTTTLIQYDKVRGRLVFVCLTANRRININFNTSTCDKILGFVKNTIVSFETNIPLESPRVCNINADSQIAVFKCNLVSSEGNSYTSTAVGSVKQSEVLLSLPVSTRPYEFINFQLRDNTLYHIISLKNIDTIVIELVDDIGRPFSLHGNDFNIDISIRKQSFR